MHNSDPTRIITLEGTDVRFPCASDDTILRAALRAGIGFPYECNVGACGNCKFQLVDGELDPRWSDAPGWTAKDRERRRFLGCQSAPNGDCTIKVRPMAQYAPVHTPHHVSATLAARRDITHDIVEFRFTLDAPMAFEPGQYALLTLPGVTGQRAYSMSNVFDPALPELHFQVRRVPGGHGTATLFDTIAMGARIDIDGPYGHAWLRRDLPRDIVCIAGGSGLAPMISIARGAAAEPRLKDVNLHFLYGGRTSADICGRDMLETLPGFNERIVYRSAISSPDIDTPVAANGASSTPVTSGAAGGAVAAGAQADHIGFVHDMAQSLLGDRLRDMEIYFAGPPAMGAAVQQMLLAHQVSFEHVHFDQFY